MKKLSLIIIVCSSFLASLNVAAQTGYKPFRIDAGLGLANTFRSIRDVGIVLNIEPKYAIKPQLSVGMKFEAAAINRMKDGKLSSPLINSILATVDYHFENKQDPNIRYFAGAGLGNYYVHPHGIESPPPGMSNNTNVGAMLRVGFEISHFRFAAAYNFAGKDTDGYYDNFFSYTIGFYIGGGKRK